MAVGFALASAAVVVEVGDDAMRPAVTAQCRVVGRGVTRRRRGGGMAGSSDGVSLVGDDCGMGGGVVACGAAGDRAFGGGVHLGFGEVRLEVAVRLFDLGFGFEGGDGMVVLGGGFHQTEAFAYDGLIGDGVAAFGCNDFAVGDAFVEKFKREIGLDGCPHCDFVEVQVLTTGNAVSGEEVVKNLKSGEVIESKIFVAEGAEEDVVDGAENLVAQEGVGVVVGFEFGFGIRMDASGFGDLRAGGLR